MKKARKVPMLQIVAVRLTEEERKVLQQCADHSGTKISQFARKATLAFVQAYGNRNGLPTTSKPKET